ncbi:MAG TPA: hypothetical protein VF377_10420 [Acidimicrobiia bacterium]
MEWWRARPLPHKITIIALALIVVILVLPSEGPTVADTTSTTVPVKSTSTLGADPAARFYAGIDSGEPCSVLYEYRNALDPKDSRIPQMNEALRAIGCFTSSSERTDQ